MAVRLAATLAVSLLAALPLRARGGVGAAAVPQELPIDVRAFDEHLEWEGLGALSAGADAARVGVPGALLLTVGDREVDALAVALLAEARGHGGLSPRAHG